MDYAVLFWRMNVKGSEVVSGPKLGWEIADEVTRFVGNTADIQFVTASEYQALEAENQRLQKQFEKETLVTSSLYQQIELLQKNWELRADAFLKLEKENAKLRTAGRGLVETLKKLDEEVDPRGGDFDPGFITQKGINLIDKALTQFGKVFED